MKKMTINGKVYLGEDIQTAQINIGSIAIQYNNEEIEVIPFNDNRRVNLFLRFLKDNEVMVFNSIPKPNYEDTIL